MGIRCGLTAEFDESVQRQKRQIYIQVSERFDIVCHDRGTATACAAAFIRTLPGSHGVVQSVMGLT